MNMDSPRNDFDFLIIDLSQTSIRNAIKNLLIECDDEFMPPLSMRNGTTQKDFNKSSSSDSIDLYFKELCNQNVIGALYDGTLVGLMSFRNKYFSNEINKYSHSNYVSTVCVKHEYRGKGVCKRLYKYLFSKLPNELQCSFISTRTWSTNDDHIRILKSLGFDMVCEIENDRKQGVNTQYFVKINDSKKRQ